MWASSSIYIQNLFLTKEWHGWGNPAHTGFLWRLRGCFVSFKRCSNIGLSFVRRGSWLRDPFTQDISRSHITSKWRASPLQWPVRPYPACPISFTLQPCILQLYPVRTPVCCTDSMMFCDHRQSLRGPLHPLHLVQEALPLNLHGL